MPTRPKTQEPDVTHVLAQMHEALRDGALGPEEIIARVEPHLDADEKERVYRHGLLSMAKTVIRQARNRDTVRRIPNNNTGAYATMRDRADDRQVKVNGRWKRLLDCTIDEIDMIVREHSGRAAQLLDRAERYRRLARVMREHDARVARDLPDGVFDAVLDGVYQAA